jgi:LacI family transcriptional regulator
VPVVCLDDDAAGAMAAEHLVGLGLKHFAFYGPAEAPKYPLDVRPPFTFQRRARGYIQALRGRGFACDPCEVDSATFYENLLSHAHHPPLIEWLDALPKPVGIFAVDDVHAHDLAEACREGGIGVPEQVAIIGVNNDELLCESAWPPLTSVECNFARMGYHAARLLERLMAGEAIADAERLTMFAPIRVQQRMSTNVTAVEQPSVAEAIHYIRLHACDPCSIEDVTAATTISRRALERQFQSAMGRTLHDEITRVRMETARRLLLQPELPIDEIAARCGFSAIQSFNRFFRQTLGLTPAAFRRQSKTNAREATKA